MIKKICDRCGEEVKRLNDIHVGEPVLTGIMRVEMNPGIRVGHICDRCVKNLKAIVKLWMKG